MRARHRRIDVLGDERQSEGAQGLEHQAKLGPRLAGLEGHHPEPARADARRELGLRQLGAGPGLADERADFPGRMEDWHVKGLMLTVINIATMLTFVNI